MNSRTDYHFHINDKECVVRNVPCHNHHGFISFNMDVVGRLPIIREKMERNEIPYDVDYDSVTKDK